MVSKETPFPKFYIRRLIRLSRNDKEGSQDPTYDIISTLPSCFVFRNNLVNIVGTLNIEYVKDEKKNVLKLNVPSRQT